MVIRLREDPSPISNRKELEDAGNNVTSTESLDDRERPIHDERLGKFISANKDESFISDQ